MSVSGSCHRMMGHSEWSVPVSVTSDDVGQVKYETEISEINCQARVQVPNPLSQQAPNPNSKVGPSLKNPKTQFFGLG